MRRKSSHDEYEDAFWASEVGKKAINDIEASNTILDEWNIAVSKVDGIRLGDLSVGDLRFLESCKPLYPMTASLAMYHSDRLVKHEKLIRLQALVSK